MDAVVEALHRIEQERLAKRVGELAGTLIAEAVHLAGATSENLTRIALLQAITLDIVATCGKESAAAHLRDMLESLEAPAGEGRAHQPAQRAAGMILGSVYPRIMPAGLPFVRTRER